MIVWPVIKAANHGSEPTLGTMINDVVTMTTPMAPPIHAHQGKLVGAAVKRGGNDRVKKLMTRMIAVPDRNEMNDACMG